MNDNVLPSERSAAPSANGVSRPGSAAATFSSAVISRIKGISNVCHHDRCSVSSCGCNDSLSEEQLRSLRIRATVDRRCSDLSLVHQALNPVIRENMPPPAVSHAETNTASFRLSHAEARGNDECNRRRDRLHAGRAGLFTIAAEADKNAPHARTANINRHSGILRRRLRTLYGRVRSASVRGSALSSPRGAVIFSASNHTFISIVRSALAKAGGAVYRFTYRRFLDYFLRRADTAEQKNRIVRIFRAVSVGVSVTLLAVGVCTILIAFPVAIGIALLAGALAALTSYYAGRLAKAASEAYIRFMPPRLAAHAAGATANALSGGGMASGVASHIAIALGDPVLQWQERDNRYRIAAGTETGIAAGTASAVYDNDSYITSISAAATVMASWIAESRKSLDDVGRLAVAHTLEGALAGSEFAFGAGFNRQAENAIHSVTGMTVSPLRALEVSSAAVYGFGKTFLHVRTTDTDNFAQFRQLEDQLPDPGPSGWFSNMPLSGPGHPESN